MWDIETFAVPPLSWSQPEAAAAHPGLPDPDLPAARSNAKLVGRRGLQFPWESGPLHGQEAAPGAGSAFLVRGPRVAGHRAGIRRVRPCDR